jgi:dTDP-4-dehydrorhamnose 3,5-epimerase
MRLEELELPGAYLLHSPVHADGRGFFREWFQFGEVETTTGTFVARQANLSRSIEGTIRGLHYSVAPEGQAKIVTCVDGVIDDVVVDVRRGSPTFGRSVMVELRAEEGRSVLVPAGCAHAFEVTSAEATVAYLLDSIYQPEFEYSITPFDPTIALQWRSASPVLSERDATAPTLAAREAAGELAPFLVRT